MSYIRRYVVRFGERGCSHGLTFQEESLDEVLQCIRDILQLKKDHDYYSHVTVSWVRNIGVNDVDAPQQVSDPAEQGPSGEYQNPCGARCPFLEG